jgi:pimeloyl-ACP methyl ester carboxylesterase
MKPDFAASGIVAPPIPLLMREVFVVADWIRGKAWLRTLPDGSSPSGPPVLTLPGFLVDDDRLRLLRMALNRHGFRAHRWKLGRNTGATADIIDRLDERVEHLLDKNGTPIALVGWSLGGLFAREYAKRNPEKISKVITLGTPFSGDPRTNNAWRLYEWVAKHPVSAPPIPMHPDAKPAVPTFALWSPNDGVVSAHAAAGLPHERDGEIALQCGHMGFICAPESIQAIIQCLRNATPVESSEIG